MFIHSSVVPAGWQSSFLIHSTKSNPLVLPVRGWCP